MEPNRSPHSSHLPNSSWPSHLYHHPHWLSSPAAASSSTLSFGTRTQTDHLDLDEDLDESESMSQTQTQGHGFQQAQNDVVHTPPDLVPDHDKEPMFEKPLTPSDVGKLNRLVIPKQHAEKHFPLSGGDGGEKGLLLSFEDEGGRTWRFRYSYWNSSQSYVLTKGWSRFVKEKRLDAGDVVSFERHRRDGSRLFIGWRRRAAARRADGGGIAAGGLTAQHGPGGGGWTRYYNAQAYPAHPPLYQHQHHLPDHCLPTGMPVAQDQAAPAGNSSRRRLRLFGVNLECQPDGWAEPSEPEGSTVRSQGPAHEQPHAQMYAAAPSDSLYYHMDMNFSRDINQM